MEFLNDTRVFLKITKNTKWITQLGSTYIDIEKDVMFSFLYQKIGRM